MSVKASRTLYSLEQKMPQTRLFPGKRKVYFIIHKIQEIVTTDLQTLKTIVSTRIKFVRDNAGLRYWYLTPFKPSNLRLPYLEAVLMELQRMFIITPVTGPRRVTKDTTLHGYNIPKVSSGLTSCILFLSSIHSPSTFLQLSLIYLMT